jgi:hypothetical protein
MTDTITAHLLIEWSGSFAFYVQPEYTRLTNYITNYKDNVERGHGTQHFFLESTTATPKLTTYLEKRDRRDDCAVHVILLTDAIDSKDCAAQNY